MKRLLLYKLRSYVTIFSSKLFYKLRKGSLVAFLFTMVAALSSAKEDSPLRRTIIWKFEHPDRVGGYQCTLLGAPQVVTSQDGSSLFFDGIDDGLIVPVNPLAGWEKFTIEVLFKPLGDGPTAPRFLHFQDSIDNRGTIEARITPEGYWYMDTFLKNGRTNERLTLIDSMKLHPCDEWYWVALVYDGKKMAHYINGKRELEGAIRLEPMDKGQISLGVRLNKVNWFKGLIKEVRFHPEALGEGKLNRFTSK